MANHATPALTLRSGDHEELVRWTRSTTVRAGVALRARIVSVTLAPPPKKYGVTHWSTRLLARHLHVRDATVARAWREYGVAPWRVETFKFSTDPNW